MRFRQKPVARGKVSLGEPGLPPREGLRDIGDFLPGLILAGYEFPARPEDRQGLRKGSMISSQALSFLSPLCQFLL
jgi:hypothetical protein